jgi:uncharacterized protein
VSLRADQVAAAFDPTYLNLILLPTEQCNFRCTYCYEDFEIGRMSPAVVASVKALLEARAPELEGLEISWFGGEPLLAKPIIAEISDHARRLSNDHSFVYSANITTNAYLLDPRAARDLVAGGVVLMQISLDGPQRVHDQTRVKATGAGTFERIWSNLLALRESDLHCEFMLRVHYSPDNVADLDPLIAQINEEFAQDERFKVYFKSIERLGGPNDAGLRVFTEADNARVKNSLDARLRRPEQVFPLGDDDYVCYAAKPNSLMIRADGSLGKCTVALRDPRNHLGRIASDGTLDVNDNLLRLWARGFASLDEVELGCPYSGLNRAVKGREPSRDVSVAWSGEGR